MSDNLAENLPNCVKCSNTRKIQAGNLFRDCVCTKKQRTVVKLNTVPAPITGEISTPAVPAIPLAPLVGQVSPLLDQVAPVEEDMRPSAPSVHVEAQAAPVAPVPDNILKQVQEAQLAEVNAADATLPVEAKKKVEAKPRTKRKTEVAYKIGRQMGYPDRVIEAIMCERNIDPLVWRQMYSDILLDPLATVAPPGYDPAKWIPGEKARNAFRDSLVDYLPNKERKVKFDDLCDIKLDIDDDE